MKHSAFLLIAFAVIISACSQGDNKMGDDAKEDFSDSWYLDDKAPETEDYLLKQNAKLSTDELIAYIRRFGSEKNKEDLTNIEIEFLQKTVNLAKEIQQERKKPKTESDPTK